MVTRDANGKSLGGLSRLLAPDQKIAPECTETVQIVTIDEAVPANRNVSILQLDVEGHEKHALIGAIKTIQRCLPILILETLPDDDWLSENILSLGYRIDQKVHRNIVLSREQANTTHQVTTERWASS